MRYAYSARGKEWSLGLDSVTNCPGLLILRLLAWMIIKKMIVCSVLTFVSVIADGKVDGSNGLIPKGEIRVLNIKSAQILSHTHTESAKQNTV